MDSQSCGASPEQLRLGCAATGRVSVTSASGAVIYANCVDLAMDPSLSMPELIAVMNREFIVGELPANEAVVISFALYSGSLEDCQSVPLGVAPIIGGRSAPTVFASQRGDISIVISCAQGSPLSESDPTQAECDACRDEVLMCLEQSGISSCDAIRQRCIEECNPSLSQACVASCSFMECSDVSAGVGPSLTCQGLAETCKTNCSCTVDDCLVAESVCTSIASGIAECGGASGACVQACSSERGCLLGLLTP